MQNLYCPLWSAMAMGFWNCNGKYILVYIRIIYVHKLKYDKYVLVIINAILVVNTNFFLAEYIVPNCLYVIHKLCKTTAKANQIQQYRSIIKLTPLEIKSYIYDIKHTRRQLVCWACIHSKSWWEWNMASKYDNIPGIKYICTTNL